MSFALYVVGFLVFIGGVAWALITAGVRPLYVIIASRVSRRPFGCRAD